MFHPAIESANKNFYLFLYKIFREWYPFQAEEWANAHKILRERLANGKRNINWKQIINHLLRESTIRGPSSNQWQTLIWQLNVLQNIENYIISPSGKEIIKWRYQQGRSRFISKCAEKVLVVKSLLRFSRKISATNSECFLSIERRRWARHSFTLWESPFLDLFLSRSKSLSSVALKSKFL